MTPEEQLTVDVMEALEGGLGLSGGPKALFALSGRSGAVFGLCWACSRS